MPIYSKKNMRSYFSRKSIKGGSTNPCNGLNKKKCQSSSSCNWELQPLESGKSRRKGLCVLKSALSPKPKATKKSSNTTQKNHPTFNSNTGVINKIHTVSYLSDLFGYPDNDGRSGGGGQIKYNHLLKPPKRRRQKYSIYSGYFFPYMEEIKLAGTKWINKFIPFDTFTQEIIPKDMKYKYNDKGFGTEKQKDKKKKLILSDSANWYNDHKKFNVNDVIIDERRLQYQYQEYLPAGFDAWLVVEYKGKKGLVMFPWGYDYNDDNETMGWYQNVSTINIKGEMIHPITGELVVVSKKSPTEYFKFFEANPPNEADEGDWEEMKKWTTWDESTVTEGDERKERILKSYRKMM